MSTMLSPRPSVPRAGFSLIELMIAMGMFAVVIGLAMESMMSTKRYVAGAEVRTDLEREGSQVMGTLTNDLANAAWFFEWNDANTNGLVDSGEPVYYQFPWVNPPLKVGSTTITSGSQNTADGAVATNPDPDPNPMAQLVKTTVNSTIYQSNPQGDRLAFFRLQTATVPTATPPRSTDGFVNLNDPNRQPVRMSDYINAAPAPALVLNNSTAAQGGDTNFVTQRWESFLASGSDSVQTFADNTSKAKLRQYLYVVERSPVTGFGRLTRRYRNGDPSTTTTPSYDLSSFTIDQVISENVLYLRFDTDRFDGEPTVANGGVRPNSRGTAGLATNQIRVVLVLASQVSDGANTFNTRRFHATVAMRSITQAE